MLKFAKFEPLSVLSNACSFAPLMTPHFTGQVAMFDPLMSIPRMHQVTGKRGRFRHFRGPLS